MINFSLSKITPQLSTERLKGYKWLLLGQLIVLINFLFLYELFQRYPFPHWQQFMVATTGGLMLLMNYFSYELIKDLTDNKFIQGLIISLLCIGVFLGIMIGINIIESNSIVYKLLSASSIVTSLLSFIILLYFMIFDIFNEKHEIIYRLWGSASIYILIGAIFGLLYTLLEMILPNEFKITGPQDIFHFIPCYNFSYYTLVGIDCPYENFSLLIRNVSVIESIFSNLYIVLVVGRLLSK
jgi:hypothetical protein